MSCLSLISRSRSMGSIDVEVRAANRAAAVKPAAESRKPWRTRPLSATNSPCFLALLHSCQEHGLLVYRGRIRMHTDSNRNLCGTVHNFASPEMLYCSSSSGEHFDKRARERRQSSSVIEGIILANHRSETCHETVNHARLASPGHHARLQKRTASFTRSG